MRKRDFFRMGFGLSTNNLSNAGVDETGVNGVNETQTKTETLTVPDANVKQTDSGDISTTSRSDSDDEYGKSLYIFDFIHSEIFFTIINTSTNTK